MIAEIETRQQYGKTGQSGFINVHPELDGYISTFAHSVQDAIEWLKHSPGFVDATIDNLGDGRYLFTTPWTPRRSSIFDDVIDDERFEQIKTCDQERTWVIIIPRNTIYENTGFTR
jgi:hypothetical protein